MLFNASVLNIDGTIFNTRGTQKYLDLLVKFGCQVIEASPYHPVKSLLPKDLNVQDINPADVKPISCRL